MRLSQLVMRRTAVMGATHAAPRLARTQRVKSENGVGGDASSPDVVPVPGWYALCSVPITNLQGVGGRRVTGAVDAKMR